MKNHFQTGNFKNREIKTQLFWANLSML